MNDDRQIVESEPVRETRERGQETEDEDGGSAEGRLPEESAPGLLVCA
jgi:hypothetical protein